MPILLFTIFVFLPITLGYAVKKNKEFLRLHGQEAKNEICANKYMVAKLVSSVFVLFGTIYFALLTALIAFTAFQPNLDFKLIYIPLLLLCIIASLIVKYAELANAVKSTFKHWLGKSLLAATILIVGIYASSYSQNQIEELTGYSVSNFHSAQHLEWLFTLLGALSISTFLLSGYLALRMIKSTFSKQTFSSEVDEYLHKQHMETGHTCSTGFLCIGSLTVTIFFTQHFGNIFPSQFVALNFNKFKHQCNEVPPNSRTVQLLKNKIDNNNVLIASYKAGKWEFNGVHCDTSSNASKPVADNPTATLAAQPSAS